MIRLLIADDHEVVRRGLQGILAEAFPGLETAEAQDFQGALARVLEEKWDLVLLDEAIPGRSAWELLEEIRRLRPGTPVLVLSDSSEEGFVLRSFKLGASGYLQKEVARNFADGRRQIRSSNAA
jgi:two-component system invasion response regulator UvrY